MAFKSPMDLELEQLQIAKNAQAIQGRDSRQGFFDSVGAQPPIGGYNAPNNPMLNPLYRQQMMMSNMQNPNAVQGAANNSGLLFGQALSSAFGQKTPDDLPVEDAEAFYTRKGAQQYATLVKQGVPAPEAMKQVATDLISKGADLNSMGAISAGQKLYKEYTEYGKKVKEIEDFTPYNMTDPENGSSKLITSKAQADQFAKLGWIKAGEKSVNDQDKENLVWVESPGNDLKEKAVRITGYDPQTGAPKYVDTGLTRSKVQNTREVKPGELTEFQDAASTTYNTVDMINQLQDQIGNNSAAGGRWSREVLNLAGNVSGSMKSMMGLTGNNPALDPKNYSDFTSKNNGAIQAAGLTDAGFTRIAYMIAAANKATAGESPRASVAETKLIMQTLGEHLGDPETVLKVLEDAKQRAVANLETKQKFSRKFNGDQEVSSWIKQVRDKASSRKPKTGAGKRLQDQSVDEFLQSLPSYKGGK